MSKGTNEPATKEDFRKLQEAIRALQDDTRILMEEFGKVWQWKADMDEWRGDIDEWRGDIDEWRGDIDEWRGGLDERLATWKQEIIDHFDLVAENIRHDLVSANREEIELLKDGLKSHDRRIHTLEHASGLAAA
jgi:hypothetical protein